MSKYLLFVLVFLPLSALAQFQSNLKPSGVNGSLGAGFIDFTVKKPAEDFELDQGVFAGLNIEKGFDFFNLYLTLSLNYLRTTGETNYDYTTLDNHNYQVDAISFDANLFQAGLGIKFKIIDDYFIRPYVEAGGLAGYYEIRYTNKQDELKAQGSEYKLRDSIFDAGHYGEGGVEISFSETFGLRAGARFINSKTKKFETLADQKIEYQANIYYLCALASF